MRAAADCLPCVLRQTLLAARRVTDDPWLHRKLLFAVMEHLPSVDFERTPAEISYSASRFASKYLGVADPFRADKALFTERMLAVENDMRREILGATDPLMAALRFALAGNMIDLGIFENGAVEEELARDAAELALGIDDYPALREALAGARSVLYLLDNAGEIVCDKLVIEQLAAGNQPLPNRQFGERPAAGRRVPGITQPGAAITCVVRKSPIINDVTREDAETVGLARLGRIIDIGVDALGVPLSHCSAEFREIFDAADVVISKGQANFETLDEAEREIFHILRAKCDHIAGCLGVSRGAAVIVRTPRAGRTGRAGAEAPLGAAAPGPVNPNPN